MSGYLIAHFSITDEEGYGRYVEATIPLLEAHNARLLVADDVATVLEGEYSDGRLVIVEFPSLEEAKAWYESPEYQEIVTIRQEATRTHSMILVASFEPPPA